MRYLDLTLPRPEDNLACDEALLELCEQDNGPALLRVWESSQPFVVLGYANSAQRDIRIATCRTERIPIFRRCSGGGTVLQGPGCLNYSLALRIQDDPAWSTITKTNHAILERHRQALQPLVPGTLTVEPPTDLALNGRKISGNAQRRKRHALLFHGTFLYQFDVQAVERVLLLPARQPAYRQGRSHPAFLANIPLTADTLKHCLRQTWGACDPLTRVPVERIKRLARARYTRDAWRSAH